MTSSSYKSPDTYSLSLPKNLPPTFKGRTFRFSYEFTIGVCRAGASPGNSSANHSRVMKIPVRVYNHVNGQRETALEFLSTDFLFSGGPTVTLRSTVSCPIRQVPTSGGKAYNC
jgi:hypothetical protein